MTKEISDTVKSFNKPDRARTFKDWDRRKWKQIPSFVIYEDQIYIHDPTRSGDELFIFRKPGPDPKEYFFHIRDLNKLWKGMMETVDLSRRILHARHEGYECSTRGDIRFSALEAMLEDGRTIECWYQCDKKGFDVGGTNWKLGKSRPPNNGKSRDELWNDYYGLWTTWCADHSVWMHELHWLAAQNDYTLADIFSGGVINQARALSQFINDHPWDGHANIIEV